MAAVSELVVIWNCCVRFFILNCHHDIHFKYHAATHCYCYIHSIFVPRRSRDLFAFQICCCWKPVKVDTPVRRSASSKNILKSRTQRGQHLLEFWHFDLASKPVKNALKLFISTMISTGCKVWAVKCQKSERLAALVLKIRSCPEETRLRVLTLSIKILTLTCVLFYRAG